MLTLTRAAPGSAGALHGPPQCRLRAGRRRCEPYGLGVVGVEEAAADRGLHLEDCDLLWPLIVLLRGKVQLVLDGWPHLGGDFEDYADWDRAQGAVRGPTVCSARCYRALAVAPALVDFSALTGVYSKRKKREKAYGVTIPCSLGNHMLSSKSSSQLSICYLLFGLAVTVPAEEAQEAHHPLQSQV